MIDWAIFSQGWRLVMKMMQGTFKEWLMINPILIQGFQSRNLAERLLQNRRIGTFIVRLSTSHFGFLVISFVCDQIRIEKEKSIASDYGFNGKRAIVHHILIRVEEDQSCYIFEEKGRHGYKSLTSLINTSPALKYYYPDIPKESVPSI